MGAQVLVVVIFLNLTSSPEQFFLISDPLQVLPLHPEKWEVGSNTGDNMKYTFAQSFCG